MTASAPWREKKVTERSPLEYALAYAALGWPVLPLRASGDTKAPDGHLVPHGSTEASTKPETIRGWWTQSPAAGIGIRMGAASGVFAIDIDPRNGGDESWDALVARLGQPPPTVEALTGGGGRHLVFAWPGDVGALVGALGPGIDVKGSGYIVAEPTVHPDSGRRYAWEASSEPLAGVVASTLPRHWLSRLAREARENGGPAEGSGYPLTAVRWAEIRSALATIPADDYAVWIEVGMALHWTGDPEAFARWEHWSQESTKFEPGQCVVHWRSFGRPQSEPVTLKSLFRRAHSLGWSGPARAVERVAEAEAPGYLLAAESAGRIRPLQWLIRDILPEKSLVEFDGRWGAYKTFMLVDMGLCIAAGRDWCGHPVTQGAVLHVIAEGIGAFGMRLRAWSRHFGVGLDGVPYAHTTSGASLSDVAGVIALRTLVERISARLEMSFSLVIVDTFARNTPGLDENATKDIGQAIALLDRHLREPLDLTVLLAHHTGHGNSDRGRGSSSLPAAADAVFLLSKDESLATLHCSKMKDGIEPPDLVFTPTVVELGLSDAYDRPMQSLVLRRKIEITGLGGNQNEALVHLRKLVADHIRNLSLAGRPASAAKVRVSDWESACGLDRKRWAEVRNSLESRGLVRLRGPYVELVAVPAKETPMEAEQ